MGYFPIPRPLSRLIKSRPQHAKACSSRWDVDNRKNFTRTIPARADSLGIHEATPMMATFRTWLLGTIPFCAMVSLNLTEAIAAEPAKPLISLDQAAKQKCLSVLRNGLRSNEFWPAMHAAEGLTIGGYGPEVITFLQPMQNGPYDDQERCGIARELVRAGDRTATEVMLKILAGNDSSGHVHAAESLFKVGELGDGSALRKSFQQTENPRLKLMAAAALGKAGDIEALEHITQTMPHQDPELARTAAWIIGQIGGKDDVKDLKVGLQKMTDEFSRAYFEHALAMVGDQGGLEALARNLNSKNAAVRTYAANFSGDAKAIATVPRLIELLEDDNLDVRVRSAQALLTLAQPAPDTTSLAVLPNAKESVYQSLIAKARVALANRREQFEQLDTLEECQAWQKSRREFFLEQIGGLPEKTPLNAQVVGELDGGDYRIEKVIYESRPDHHVTAVVYLPKNLKPPYPGVLISCGHTKTGKAADYNQKFGILLAKNGMAAMCYDPIGQGERSQILTDEGHAEHTSSTTEHFLTGIGAILTGTNTAQYRIWDGIRGIDYLCERKDIIPEKIGFTGCSGGGTLTSYIMALDDRVYCAAPACYLTTFEKLIETIGPQDAEQNIHAQIAFGMEQTDYVLMRAPKPTLICSTTGDFFDIEGTWDTFRQSKSFYAHFGQPEQVDLVETPGKHGVTDTGREAIVRWMQRWLLGIDKDVTNPNYKLWTEKDLQCTPKGQVLLLEGEKSVFDLNVERAERFEKPRQRFAKLPIEEARDVVRKVAGIRPLDQLPKATLRSIGIVSGKEYRIRKLVMDVEGGVSVPILRIVPDKANGERTLYLAGNDKQDCLENSTIQDRLNEGQEVWVTDLPGIGELRNPSSSKQLGDWKTFYLAYLLEKPLAGMRTETVLNLARLVASDSGDNAKPIHLMGEREAEVALLHAKSVEPKLFHNDELNQERDSWAEVCKQTEPVNQLSNSIHGVLMHYDLPDLDRLMK